MDMLDIYTDYLICQNKHATSTGLSEMLEGEIAHDKEKWVKKFGPKF